MRTLFRTRLLGGLLALWPASTPCLAHDDHDAPPRPPPAPGAPRPTSVPDRIIRTFAGDPARTLAVTWRTDSAVEKAIAQIAPADAGPKFAARARTVPARSTTLTTDLGAARYHSV